MNHWELNEEQRKQLGWTTNAAVDTGEMGNIYDRVKMAAGLEAAAARKVRPALPMFGEPVADPDTIFDYSIKSNRVLDIPSNQRLVSVELSRKFQIRPEHFGNAGVAQ